MQIQQNISLKPFNTFGIDVKARYYASFSNLDELVQLTEQPPQPTLLILGGGSNVLFTTDVDGLVLKNEIKGINIVYEDDEFVYLRAGAGENWHQFVLHCVRHELAGVENLSLIPGNTGAAPMQNIGAYGVEIKDVFHELQAFHLQEKKLVRFSLDDCMFGYRESVFKRKYKDQFAILTVTYKLRKKPVFNISYGAIRQEVDNAGIKDLSIKAVSDAVIRIRSSKLPNPALIGNAGSFFKNPQVSREQFEALQQNFPLLVAYSMADGSMKLAAGWLIEQCGWKGYRKNDAGCYTKQALVLVNYAHATGKEIYDLSTAIVQSVCEKFDVLLEREVNII